MSHHLSRAEILLAQSRPADAEREARLALAQNPGDPGALTVLARALSDQDRGKDALQPARAAVAAAPDSPYAHHIHAHVLHRIDRPREALAASETALGLEPDDDDLLAQRAAIRLSLRDWPAALADSEAALRINAANTNAQNLRAMALRQLGRAAEADAVGTHTLSRDPNDAFSHANQGWNALHRNDPRRAQEHFREALRLDASLDYARQGLLEALKARNPIYRGMLAYFLWMGRMSHKIQFAFIIGVVFGNNIVRNLSNTRPDLIWLVVPLQVLFYGFIYLSWTSVPMFNFTLLLDRFGRQVLTRRERVGALLFGVSFVVVIAALVWWTTGGAYGLLMTKVAAYVSAFVAATTLATGYRAWIFGLATAALAALGGAGLVLLLNGNLDGVSLINLFLLSSLGFMLLALFLKTK